MRPLKTHPGESMQATGVLPMRLATSVNESKVSLLVLVVRITSTSLKIVRNSKAGSGVSREGTHHLHNIA